MPDVNDVINGLERCLAVGCDDCNQPDKSGYPWDCEGFDRMVNEAVVMLKEREPVKPIPDTSYGARPWWFVCGNCKLSINEDQKYCPNCGKRVNWE